MPVFTQPETIDVKTLHEWLSGEKTPLLIDVREDHEWEQAHVAQAFHLPLSRFDPALLPEQQGRPLVVMCLSGLRSAHAISQLAASGYPGGINLQGGLVAWVKAGYPVLAGR